MIKGVLDSHLVQGTNAIDIETRELIKGAQEKEEVTMHFIRAQNTTSDTIQVFCNYKKGSCQAKTCCCFKASQQYSIYCHQTRGVCLNGKEMGIIEVRQ